MTTKDIVAYANEHFSTAAPLKIEWVDDTAANIPYQTSELALEALRSFAASEVNPSEMQLLPAKASSSHPSASLYVRLAVQSDRKKPRAAAASRFYLMHPEHDPRERPRREPSQRRRNRRRGDDDEYRRRRFDDREHRRRKEEEADCFDASMYDDGTDTRNTSRSSKTPTRRYPRRGSGDLFSPTTDRDNTRGRLRNRSASPARNRVGDEDVDFSDDRRRFRKRTPPPDYSLKDPHPFPRENQSKELFPTTKKELFPTTTSQTLLKSRTPNPPPSKELFPDAAPPAKELFPSRLSPPKTSKHRRSDAFDAAAAISAADETADLFSKRMAIPFVDGSKSPRGRSGNGNGINIRGAAGDQGMSIRGSGGMTIKGAAGNGNGTVSGSGMKELFPGSVGNRGKELFSEKLEGRGGRTRRRAEDMFY
jgi:hypothetical protein